MKKIKENRNYTGIFICCAMAAVLIIFCFLVFGIWKEYKDAIINNQKKQMLLTTQSMGENLKVFIEGYQADLSTIYDIVDDNYKKTGTRDWSIISQYVSNHKRFVYDVIVEDTSGKLIKSIKGYGVEKTYSVTAISKSEQFLQCKLENGDLYLVLKRNLPDIGSISIVINERSYYKSLVSNIRLGTNGYVVIKDSKGIILAHPQEKQWGINVITGRKKMFPGVNLNSLEQMIDKQNRGEEGVSEYYSYWWVDPGVPEVKKISAYSPAHIGDGFLVVSAVIDYNDIYIPVATGFFKLGLVFFCAMAIVLGLVIYIGDLRVQKRKDTEEIAYLLELNKILEEIHQSEETIAHQQRLQIMGTMTGGIAHEFNNLLTPIMGYAELLMMDLPERSENYENASEIYEASAKAKEIIQQISSLSRKNMETAFKNLHGEKVIKRAIKMVSSVCPTNIHLNEMITLQEECFLGNETQLNQVILNICVNAIHAIGHKEGTISISCQTVDREELAQYKLSTLPEGWDHYIRIDVEDDGEGMSDEVLKQIFDPFFTTKKNGKGTGLGLSLVEQIIHSHKGYVFAESTLGKGSIFHLYLPVNEQKEREDQIQLEAGGPVLRIMIVDDNPKVLRLLEKNFSRLNVPLISCMDFDEARRVLKEQGVDAVVTEQYVKGKSGVDFCMSLQGPYPGVIRILMTDRVTKELIEAKKRRMIDEYIDKPVSDSSILKAVKNFKDLY
ncbi:ATP-binding protein [Lacrimispora defluvii]|uniref:Stage 0 sporulation protein A homolog n=1 Tax=Lacrimispora defluvii TaxID=2719233 RepID=A0ABX1VRB2_9FIRM|nr:ATP-binding protein [Lacrimispora defluvii]NNJ29826.1 response regulator [Lacrimispora defluvii]